MATVYDVPADVLIREVARDLKENVKIEQPLWASVVKTGVSRERKPSDDDWWWVRAASVMRRIYIDGPLGVQRLRTYYGGRKNRGHKPEHFFRGGGKIIRTILRELDAKGFTESSRSGRRLTRKGQSYMDGLSSKLAKK